MLKEHGQSGSVRFKRRKTRRKEYNKGNRTSTPLLLSMVVCNEKWFLVSDLDIITYCRTIEYTMTASIFGESMRYN